ncbi:ABC transporter permease [Myxococcus sp. CA040A]|uniref:ABC transporter permease n=1 Tax=Myxococcus llanfairpwllgwyngyllgogerychwyrndrobwllllantysiliogogogochensis TaxID=2590453 RepID=A0A540WVD0_9BACT|nr:ABC transporter permease [Myxococcus sp. CA040A]TQF12968.1 ABC transporter permease [Myxococcus llanfairpwllgwyngyllgogerychwyrndrobwllllantysiliogogogochensis]
MCKSDRVTHTLDGLKETLVIWGAELQRAVRSGRAVVLLGLYSMFSALVLLVIGKLTSDLRTAMNERLAGAGADAESATRLMEETRKGVLGFLTSNDTSMMEALAQVPIEVLLVFKVTLFFLPAYVALMGFDQISGEVAPRSMRYLTVRARRSSVLLGKFLTQAALLVGLVLVIDLAIFIYARIANPDFGSAALIINLLKFWFAAIVFSLAYVALTTLCSSLFRTPGVSLVFNFILLFVFWLMDTVGRASGETGALRFLRYLSPSNYAGDLLHPKFTEFGISGAAYAGFATLFLLGAYGALRARDL